MHKTKGTCADGAFTYDINIYDINISYDHRHGSCTVRCRRGDYALQLEAWSCADYCYHVHSSFHGLHIAVHSSLAHSSRCQFKRIRAYTASLLPALVRCSFTCDGVSIGNAQRQASCLQGVAAAATEMLHLSLRRVVSIRALVDGCSKASQMH